MRKFLSLVAALSGALAVTALPAGPAYAMGGESLGCRIAPHNFSYTSPTCSTWDADYSHTINFAVLGGSGTYTYAWTVTGNYTAVVSGCTSTSSFCNVSTTGYRSDKEVEASVTITQGGQSATLSAYAFVPASCGSYLC